MSNVSNIALAYHQGGFTPLWIPLGSKAAKAVGWQSIEQSPERIAREFSRPSNVGILMGVKLADGSCVIGVDIDVDDVNVIRVTTHAIGQPVPGKRGKKGITLFMRTLWPVKKTTISLKRNGKKTPCIDILGQSSQTVVPPSIHPDTQLPYVWVQGRPLHEMNVMDLPYIDPSFLDEIAGFCADPEDKIAALNDMHWAGVGGGGNTHLTCVEAVFEMVRRGWTDDPIYERVHRAKVEACEAAGEAYDWPGEGKAIKEWIARLRTYTDD